MNDMVVAIIHSTDREGEVERVVFYPDDEYDESEVVTRKLRQFVTDRIFRSGDAIKIVNITPSE